MYSPPSPGSCLAPPMFCYFGPTDCNNVSRGVDPSKNTVMIIALAAHASNNSLFPQGTHRIETLLIRLLCASMSMKRPWLLACGTPFDCRDLRSTKPCLRANLRRRAGIFRLSDRLNSKSW